MRRLPATVAAFVVAAVLAGCTPEEPAPSATTAPSPTPTPTATADATPAPEPADGWSAPASCTSIPLTAGGTIAGSALGPCIEQAFSSFGSGRVALSSAAISGTVSFTYAPAVSFQAALETGDGPLELTFVDGMTWVDYGDGPIRGDRDSDVLDEQMASVAGDLYRVFSDPAFAADLIGASPEWIVEAATDRIPAAGEPVTAHRIVSAEPFAWFDIPIQEYAVWVAPDWTPVAAESTSDFLSARTTVTQEFHDLGEPVTIVAPE